MVATSKTGKAFSASGKSSLSFNNIAYPALYIDPVGIEKRIFFIKSFIVFP